jgi:hypothetical protein
MRNAAIILLSLGLVACGGGETETPGAATQRAVDRSVADIRAAEAAAAQPLEVSRSVGELTGKAAAEAPKDGTAAGDPGETAPAGG